MKRSNRLVLLIGVLLAVVAFVGILIISQPKSGDGTTGTKPKTVPVVVATADVPLGAKVQATQVKVVQLDTTAVEAGAYADTSQVVGKTVRSPISNGAQVTSANFTSGGSIGDVVVPQGKRAMAVRVTQDTGVGTVIKAGDYVDMVVGYSNFPVITINPADDSPTIVSGVNSLSVKVLIQGMQVLGTLLPPPPANSNNNSGATASPGTGTDSSGGTTTTLSDSVEQIVILAVDAQQVELIKDAQLDGSISLVLRAADDFLDTATKLPLPDGPVPDTTTGIILKSLVDTYGVLPPELVETVLPAQASPSASPRP